MSYSFRQDVDKKNKEYDIWRKIRHFRDANNFKDMLVYLEQLKETGSDFEKLRAHFYLGCFYAFEGRDFGGYSVPKEYHDKYYDYKKALAELETAYRMNYQLYGSDDDVEYLLPIAKIYLNYSKFFPVFNEYNPTEYFKTAKVCFDKINPDTIGEGAGFFLEYYPTLIYFAILYDSKCKESLHCARKDNMEALKYYERAIMLVKKYKKSNDCSMMLQRISEIKSGH